MHRRQSRHTRLPLWRWLVGLLSVIPASYVLVFYFIDNQRPSLGGHAELVQVPKQIKSNESMGVLGEESVGDMKEFFIRIQDGGFVEGCKPFRVSGWNQWEVVEAAAGTPMLFGSSFPPGKTGPQMVRDMMEEGKKYGFNVIRIWAHSVSVELRLQTAPGKYNEAMFRGLDYALDLARRLRMHVILSFTDNWSLAGGVAEYVKWSPTADRHNDFFTDRHTKNYYRAHVAAVIERVNTINGRMYRDDPTIMAWNLINEPRCVDCPQQLQSWISEMADYVKQLDDNHLLTVGLDGFYGPGGRSWINPKGAGQWSEQEGQDFVEGHLSGNIDFSTFHSWMDNWGDPTESFVRLWISEHVADAKAMGKPILLQEFGNKVQPGGPSMEDREKFFAIVYDEVEKGMKNGPLMGALFWQWFDEGQLAPYEEGGGGGVFGIYSADDTFQKIMSFTSSLLQRDNGVIKECVDNHASEVGEPSSCRHTWVNGVPGTGFEGPQCDIDINECVRGTAKCPPNAGCLNSRGGFRCDCHFGAIANGSKACAPRPPKEDVELVLTTHGVGSVACIEGRDIIYPEGAPGFVYDPTGSAEYYKHTRGQVGSRSKVSVSDCQIACKMAVECDSFAFNAYLGQCFLKKCASKETCRRKETVCDALKTKEKFYCGQWQTYYYKERFRSRKCSPSEIAQN